jgi:hypothetical protein
MWNCSLWRLASTIYRKWHTIFVLFCFEILILCHVMPLRTPFRLLIGFITISHLQSFITLLLLYTNTCQTLIVCNSSSHANYPWLSPAENCSVVPMVFKITPLHRPHGKRVAPLLSVCLLSCCITMVTAWTTENQLHNSHSAISLALIAA